MSEEEDYVLDCTSAELFKAFKQMQEDWKKPLLTEPRKRKRIRPNPLYRAIAKTRRFSHERERGLRMDYEFVDDFPKGSEPKKKGFDVASARKKAIELIDANIELQKNPGYKLNDKTPRSLVKGDVVGVRYGNPIVELNEKGQKGIKVKGTTPADFIAALEWLKAYVADGKADEGLKKAYDRFPKGRKPKK